MTMLERLRLTPSKSTSVANIEKSRGNRYQITCSCNRNNHQCLVESIQSPKGLSKL
jgi:hypothetical protein